MSPPKLSSTSETSSDGTVDVTTESPASKTRVRRDRKFPVLAFEDSLLLARAIQTHAAGQRVRRIKLFEQLDKSPDSGWTRRLITSSSQYGLTKGNYSAEFIELTPTGATATSDDVPVIERLQAKFDLAIGKIKPFNALYERYKGSKLPAREILADSLVEEEIPEEHRNECVDTFTVNLKFLNLLRTIAGAERLISIEQVLEESHGTQAAPMENADESLGKSRASDTVSTDNGQTDSDTVPADFSGVCFYVTPIGEANSTERAHADFMMEYVIKPALREFDLQVIRADQMGQPGMIGRQVVEHILKARLVIADLSFHNPNVFYELCLRHTTRLPTVQVKRTVDRLPFDLNQSRTISIDTSDVYGLYPKLQVHIAEIATQVRRSLQDTESPDNPVSLYYPKAKLSWS